MLVKTLWTSSSFDDVSGVAIIVLFFCVTGKFKKFVCERSLYANMTIWGNRIYFFLDLKDLGMKWWTLSIFWRQFQNEIWQFDASSNSNQRKNNFLIWTPTIPLPPNTRRLRSPSERELTVYVLGLFFLHHCLFFVLCRRACCSCWQLRFVFGRVFFILL